MLAQSEIALGAKQWSEVRQRLQEQLPPGAFESWFPTVRVEGMENGTVYLSVATRFLRDHIRSCYAPALLTAWKSVNPWVTAVSVSYRTTLTKVSPSYKEAGRLSAARALKACAAPPLPAPKEPPMSVSSFEAWLEARPKRDAAVNSAVPGRLNHLMMGDVLVQVAARYRVSHISLLTKTRGAEIVRVRRIAMYLIRAVTKKSYLQIGHYMGGRDYSTVVDSIRRIRKLRSEDPEFAEELDRLERALRQSSELLR